MPLKWDKETEQPDKVPFTATAPVYSSWQQQPQVSDKTLSSLSQHSKPSYSMMSDGSHRDSGIFSAGSYLSINGDAEKHGILSHDQSSLEFYPLHAFIDTQSPKVNL